MNSLPGILVIVAALTLSSCSLIIKAVVNDKLPARSIEDYKTHAISAQVDNMAQIKRPDFRAHLCGADVTANLDSVLRRTFREKPNFGIEVIETFQLSQAPEVTLEEQAFRVKIITKITFKDVSVQIGQKETNISKKIRSLDLMFEGFVTPYVHKDKLILLPAIENVCITRIKVRGFSPVWAVKPIFNYLIPIIKENLNGYFINHPDLFAIPLDIKPIPEKMVSELLEDTGNLTVEHDFKIEIKKKVGPVVFRINSAGVDMLAEFVRDERTVDSSRLTVSAKLVEENVVQYRDRKVFKNEVRVAKYQVRHNLADLANAGRRSAVADQFSNSSIYGAAYSNVSLLRGSIRELPLVNAIDRKMSNKGIRVSAAIADDGVSPRRTARNMRREEIPRRSDFVAFTELFGRYSQMFDTLSATAFDPVGDIRKSEVSVSKKFISLLTNEVFANPELVLVMKPNPLVKVGERTMIEIIERPTFDCSRVLTNCGSLTKNCGENLLNCNFGCKWYKPWCYAAEGACHLANGAIWSLCQVNNGIIYAGCQVENVAKYSWCTLTFLAEYLAYEVLYIGDYDVSATANLIARLQLDHIGLDENLTSLNVTTKVSARGEYDVLFRFYPRTLAWLLCPVGMNCPLHNSFSVDVPDAVHAKIEPVTLPNAPDRLLITFDGISLDIKTQPIFLQWLGGCDEGVIECPLKILGLTVAGVVYAFAKDEKIKNYLRAFWLGIYSHKIDPYKLNMEIPSFNLDLPNGVKTATSEIGKKSVSYVF